MIHDHSVVFLGSKETGLSVCQTLVETLPKGALRAIVCPDDSTDQRSATKRFTALAEANKIPFYVVKSVAETKELIIGIAPALALVHGWYQILPVEELMDTIFLGFHYSLLPKYRGNAPLVWQIINGEKQLGVSFFQLTAGMDEGGLVSQASFTLCREESVADALLKAGDLTQRMLHDFLTDWTKGPLRLAKQPSEIPSYCGLRLPGDGKINWHSNADKVHDFIRAQSKPYPGAFTFLPDGRKLTVWKSSEEERRFFGVPGSVVELSGNDVVVACGSGAIRLQTITVEDGVEQAPRNFIKSLKIRLE
jgi:methionyl-tRNA formyltransferase